MVNRGKGKKSKETHCQKSYILVKMMTKKKNEMCWQIG